MLKLSFEGETIADVNQAIEEYLSSGSSPAAAASGSSKRSPKKEKAPEPVTQDTIRDFMIKMDGKDDQIAALLKDFGAARVSKLKDEQLDEFFKELQAL